MNFKSYEGFCDLCVNVPNGGVDSLNDILVKLYEMGYRTVALNQTVNDSAIESDKKKKQKLETNVVPNPIDVSKLNEKWKGKLCILNRITLICSSVEKAHVLTQHANFRKYDIFALAPTKQDLLEKTCEQTKADLITLRPEISGIKINRKVYRQAIARDLYFEIQYVDLLRRSTRVAVLHHSYQLQMCRINMNIIMSSGASNKKLIRNPYDIINLGCALGLRRDIAKAVILNECQLLLLKAKKRIAGKAVFTVEIAEEPEEDDEEVEKKRRKN
ncbi:ribonuclease P protein subunit p30 [Solenopsis invicta]|uniref:ribonuclease P protein subunit p30 n=1 Tax=Solenopsis invicta TaxID=13686 RepID=UPI0001FE9214|nr:ribonuclease P protein subunit p30 [Solenopsis invicta]XP_011160542.1 ribonuclease P protein subunit p30 [Solenopsis invicta]